MADQYAKWNSEHAARNRGSDSGQMSSPAGGSATDHTPPGPKASVRPVRSQSDIKGIKKLAAGRPDVAKGKNVV
jgi:hypothetical protein